jgi:hypothetical protein
MWFERLAGPRREEMGGFMSIVDLVPIIAERALRERLGIRLDRVGSLRAPAGNGALLWRGRLPAGATVELRGRHGQVRIDASEDDQLEVTAAHSDPRAANSAIEVKVVEHRHGLSVCALAGALKLVARVPRGVHVIASTIDGDVEVVGVSGNVEAGTTNGRVILLPATG